MAVLVGLLASIRIGLSAARPEAASDGHATCPNSNDNNKPNTVRCHIDIGLRTTAHYILFFVAHQQNTAIQSATVLCPIRPSVCLSVRHMLVLC